MPCRRTAWGCSPIVRSSASYVLRAGQDVNVLRTISPAATTTIHLTGNSLGQVIQGNVGINIINGGAGNDVLTGGAGNDFFVFNTALIASINRDAITDFNVAAYTVRLENSVFTALGATTGTLASSKFFVGTAAHDADDRFIYNSANGALIYDSNGLATGRRRAVRDAGEEPRAHQRGLCCDLMRLEVICA